MKCNGGTDAYRGAIELRGDHAFKDMPRGVRRKERAESASSSLDHRSRIAPPLFRQYDHTNGRGMKSAVTHMPRAIQPQQPSLAGAPARSSAPTVVSKLARPLHAEIFEVYYD